MVEEENHKNGLSGESVEQNLADDYVPKKKLAGLPVSNEVDAELKKQMDKTKKEIDKFKAEITKKFKYVEAIGLIPAQASVKVEEEYEVPEEEAKKKLIHILTVVPEEKFKEIGKVRLEAIKLSKEINEKFWVHVMTPVDIWNLCLDSKFDVVEALAMSFPVLDKGLLGALRVAEIHKTLVLKKFEKYVTSYIISGSLVRGTTHKDSDVDIFIIIDDTDVKRMPRLELKEKLRGIIFSYIQEASAIAGVKNLLNVQVYLMTEFWEAVKDAVPVMFTFIRDGVPLYDRGTFLPWKSLLRMGKIKPSPEAIDMFMSSGDKLKENVDRRLMDIAVMDIYWGVLTPSQGLLMLYGLAPPTPKETVKLIREVLYEKEKLLEKKYVDIFESVISFYKDYEHGKNKTISGVDLDKMAKDAYDYMARLKELREQIEKRVQEKSIGEVYKDVFGMLGALLKKKSESAIIKEFDEQLVKQGKFPQRFVEALKFVAKVKKDVEKEEKKDPKAKKKDEATGKMMRDVDKARKMASEIVNALVEYTQRCDFLAMDRTRFILKPAGGRGDVEVFFLGNIFVVQGPKIQKLENGKLKASNSEELKGQLMTAKDKEGKIDFSALEDLKKVFGDFELVY
ncbi:hypothetical protein CMI37_17460 [Candidatus Pacearchaeota archaeon]|nr:hypothetical protein [Candidatus Pacearchaeota archaeon]|tara:strand:- start:2167 stop:4032 length:1866 start_codon:yes stop_codon:yes gene_type:complete